MDHPDFILVTMCGQASKQQKQWQSTRKTFGWAII
jgi:hypothetical protein